MLINLVLAWRIWNGNPKNAVEIFFGLTILLAALWIAGLVADSLVIAPKTVSMVLRLIHTAPILIAFFFYLFTYQFPYKTFQLSRKQKIALVLLASAITVITITPNLMIASEVHSRVTLRPYFNFIWYIPYALYFLALVALAFKNLFSKLKLTSGIYRRRVKQVLIATSVAFIGGALFNLILPLFFNRYFERGYIAPLFTVFTAVYIWYHIFFHWRIKIVRE